MLIPGLVSITFRKLTPREIIELSTRAGLASIEWGGDVHVPHGETALAKEIARMSSDAGLAVSAYGSYYRMQEDEPIAFNAVLDTAVALGAPVIRVWSGNTPSLAADSAERARIVQESRRIADLAASAGISVAYEFHGGTLTDNTESAVHLLRDVDHPNVKTFWQPPVSAVCQENLASLNAVTPWLANLHVFHWGGESGHDRRPLNEGATVWPGFLQRAAAVPGNHYVSLEFVQDDNPENLWRDADTLLHWLAQVRSEKN